MQEDFKEFCPLNRDDDGNCELCSPECAWYVVLGDNDKNIGMCAMQAIAMVIVNITEILGERL